MSNNSPESPEALADRARAVIEKQPHFRGANYPLKFESFEKVLLVTGKLPSFYLKQVLQSELMRMSGVARIENQVHVDRSRFGS